MSQQNLEKIVIIDYGSQVTQLIARKIRELGVYSEIFNLNQAKKIKKNYFIKGIVLSGGPLTITNKNSLDLPNHILKSLQRNLVARLKYQKQESLVMHKSKVITDVF